MLGDKFSTLEGQKATVINLMNAEDMPFFMGSPELPPYPDVLLNISANKRQTLGMLLGGLLRTAKCSKPSIDLTALYGDSSIQPHLSALLEQAMFVQKQRLCNGMTGHVIGYADIFTIPFVRYEQDGLKTAYFTAGGEDVIRSEHGANIARGKNRLGGLKVSQTCIPAQVACGATECVAKQDQISAEAPLCHDFMTGCVTPCSSKAYKFLSMQEISTKTLFYKNYFAIES
ncbi:hypothetical protein B4U80_13483 [Leptotrombidium deliense]|uniref:DNA-directed RNA polymerase n=1 Tax=Leptotrombidium deliense TaxID=299467 RepID=A0A443S5K6_9ACAR|nr:hypothetical protein B4U80_13483 [Leptotrombidium deliense]